MTKKKSEIEKMIGEMNDEVMDLIGKFKEDLDLAKNIQKTLVPDKFPQVPGLSVKHRYLSGLKSGGDYLDFFEFDDKTHVGILMSDSSGYGVSSTFLSLMLKMAVSLSKDEARSPAATVKRIFEHLSLTMKPKEDFSIFYAILNRKTLELRYTGTGSVHCIHLAREGGRVSECELRREPLRKDDRIEFIDKCVDINPGERLVVLSDGFYKAFKTPQVLHTALETHAGDEPLSFINDCAWNVKKTFAEKDDMPEQDCSVMVVDVEKTALRIAK